MLHTLAFVLALAHARSWFLQTLITLDVELRIAGFYPGDDSISQDLAPAALEFLCSTYIGNPGIQGIIDSCLVLKLQPVQEATAEGSCMLMHCSLIGLRGNSSISVVRGPFLLESP